LHTKDAREYPGLSTIVLDHLANQSSDLNFHKENWNEEVKSTLCDVVEKQYTNLGLAIPSGLIKIRMEGVSTVTTGHQLQIAGGPAFLHYKTITTIRLARKIEEDTGKKVVPVFWLASEDHDFKEVSWVNGDMDKHVWSSPVEESKLPVGRLPLHGVKECLESWGGDMGQGFEDIKSDIKSINECYELSNKNGESYSELFRRWMHLWYGDTELIVLDADSPKLKALASGLFSEEFTENGISEGVRKTSNELIENGFKATAHIRDVNLFYMPDGESRVGIIKDDVGGFRAGEIVLNKSGLDWRKWCEENAEKLSPGVLLRPIYQELLLPNLRVVVGPGELSYWKQLDGAFKLKEIEMPGLHLRDHVLVLDNEMKTHALEVGWSFENGWWDESEWVRKWIESKLPSKSKDVDVALVEIKQLIQDASSTVDSTLMGAATASAIGMQKIWQAQQKKINKAIRRQNTDKIQAISRSALRIFKNNSPQDRYMNFHHLASQLGGFNAFRDLLLNAEVPHKNVTSSFIHIVDEN
jgi:bacillithiol biosynthesis cysteine-adding enzyme BshC